MVAWVRECHQTAESFEERCIFLPEARHPVEKNIDIAFKDQSPQRPQPPPPPAPAPKKAPKRRSPCTKRTWQSSAQRLGKTCGPDMEKPPLPGSNFDTIWPTVVFGTTKTWFASAKFQQLGLPF